MNYQDAFDVELQPGQSLIARLDHTGDTKIVWNRSNAAEASLARSAFNKAKADGFMAYRVSGEKGVRGEILREFDPDAERIILAPPLQGGHVGLQRL